MSLTPSERRELADIERRARELRQRKNSEAKAKASEARKAREKALVRTPGQRAPRERDPGYLAFLRRLPCAVGLIKGDCCGGRTDPAHIRFTDRKAGRLNPGMSAKPDDRWCVCVCRFHHEAQHAYGNEAKWWAVEVGVDPSDLARALHAAYLAGEDGTAVLRRFTPTTQGADHG